mmetsp:Transcript_39260/g.108185  ORF Transcript_39260/g.108185 Transcript_39260/m.108185 type:complete len:231 (+) Transcript_39260:728-1420(+)
MPPCGQSLEFVQQANTVHFHRSATLWTSTAAFNKLVARSPKSSRVTAPTDPSQRRPFPCTQCKSLAMLSKQRKTPSSTSDVPRGGCAVRRRRSCATKASASLHHLAQAVLQEFGPGPPTADLPRDICRLLPSLQNQPPAMEQRFGATQRFSASSQRSTSKASMRTLSSAIPVEPSVERVLLKYPSLSKSPGASSNAWRALSLYKSSCATVSALSCRDMFADASCKDDAKS